MKCLPAVKRCSRCFAILEATGKNFRRKARTRDGFSDWCRPCCLEYEADRRAIKMDRKLGEQVFAEEEPADTSPGRLSVEVLVGGNRRVRFGTAWRPDPDRMRLAVTFRCDSLMGCE